MSESNSNIIKSNIVKIEEGGLDLFYFSFYFYFILFSIFRITRVRVDWSRCHICHNMMA